MTKVMSDMQFACPKGDMHAACRLRQELRHAWRDERAADCLRFADPAEATGGLEAWRLGGYIKKTIKNHKIHRGSPDDAKTESKLMQTGFWELKWFQVGCRRGLGWSSASLGNDFELPRESQN